MQRDTCHVRKMQPPAHRNGSPKAGDSLSITEERNRRTMTEIANDRFVTALVRVRQDHLLAGLVETPVPNPPTSFELAMERVRNGAAIVEVVPFNRRPDPTYTLAGVGSRWMAS